MNDLVTRENQAKQLLKSQMSVIQTLTGKDEVKSSTFASAILAQVTNKNLINCSVDSIIKNGIEIVRLGLNPNPTFGQAYIVPFKTKNGGEIAQLQIGFKGFLNLAYRNGWIFRAVCVYTCDKFKIEFAGISDKITYEPNFEARQDDNAKWVHSNLIGVIVYAMDSQKTEFSEFVPFSKLEKLRLKSQNQNDKNELKYIWAEWSEEMYKAKALKYVATRLPITEQIQNAINSENVVYSDNANLTQNNGFKTQNEAEVIESIDLNKIALNEPLKEQEIAEAEINYFAEVKNKLEEARANEVIKNYVLNAIGKNPNLAQEFYNSDEKLTDFINEFVAKETKERKENAKEALKSLLIEKGLTEYEVIDFISKKAHTIVLANQFLYNSEKLENALKDFFNN